VAMLSNGFGCRTAKVKGTTLVMCAAEFEVLSVCAVIGPESISEEISAEAGSKGFLLTYLHF
jgi:hypothetical protein